MATDRIQTGIRFPEALLRKITYIAKKNHRSLNAQLEHLAQDAWTSTSGSTARSRCRKRNKLAFEVIV